MKLLPMIQELQMYFLRKEHYNCLLYTSSLRYGAVPIIRKTGGLKDTVSIYNPKSKTGTGFGFTDYNAEGFLDAILAALDVYKKNPEEWKNLTAKGMRKNYSWKASSRKYEKLYSDL